MDFCVETRLYADRAGPPERKILHQPNGEGDVFLWEFQEGGEEGVGLRGKLEMHPKRRFLCSYSYSRNSRRRCNLKFENPKLESIFCHLPAM